MTITTTGLEYPTLAGNLAAVISGLILTLAISWVKPDNFDWEITRAMNAKNAMINADSDSSSENMPEADAAEAQIAPEEKHDPEKGVHEGSVPATPAAIVTTTPDRSPVPPAAELAGALRLAVIGSTVLTFIVIILVPMPMFGSHYIFSKHFFTGWVVISFLWVFSSAFISTVMPIWETRHFFLDLARAIIGDLNGRSRK